MENPIFSGPVKSYQHVDKTPDIKLLTPSHSSSEKIRALEGAVIF